MAKILKNNLIETDQDLFRKTIKDRITPQEWNRLSTLAKQSNELADFLSLLTEWLYGGGDTPPMLPDSKSLLGLIEDGPLGDIVQSINGYIGDVVLDSGDIEFDKNNPEITLKEMFDWDK